jgi:hypothetical protein
VENKGSDTAYGMDSAFYRMFKVTSLVLPGKIQKDDYLKVPFGSKPNFVQPAGVPNWGSGVFQLQRVTTL